MVISFTHVYVYMNVYAEAKQRLDGMDKRVLAHTKELNRLLDQVGI